MHANIDRSFKSYFVSFFEFFEKVSSLSTRHSLNVKKTLAVINATYTVAKKKPEKIRLANIRTLTSAIPVQPSYSLSSQPTGSWSLNWFVIYPGKMKMKL